MNERMSEWGISALSIPQFILSQAAHAGNKQKEGTFFFHGQESNLPSTGHESSMLPPDYIRHLPGFLSYSHNN
jgi:hypothetical protein